MHTGCGNVDEEATTMDTFHELLIKDTPKYRMKCDNCGNIVTVETASILDKDEYSFTCPQCGQTSTNTDIQKWIGDKRNQYMTLGII